MPESLEPLRDRAKPWTAPISEQAPGGTSAKSDPDYEWVSNEVAKLESLSGGVVDWAEVVSRGSRILESRSKDLLIASYVAYGLAQTRGLDGLITGLTLVCELTDQFWPSLFPEQARMRGRVNAVGWLLDRVAVTTGALKVGPGDAAGLDVLGTAVKRLAEVTREKFGNSAPSFGALLTSVERLKLNLPAPPPAPAPAHAATPAPAPPPVGTAQPAVQQSVAAPPPAPPPPAVVSPAPVSAANVVVAPAVTLTPGADTSELLQNLGQALISAAGELRRANNGDPAAYRLIRTGMWLHISAPPPSSAGKTPVPPLAPALRAQLERLAGNARWPELLDESEGALIRNRFCLDLHRLSAQALRGLGPSHGPARKALMAELAAFLDRLPSVVDLTASDGTPLADPETRAWLDAEVLATSAAAPQPVLRSPGEDVNAGAVYEEARTLARAGNAASAIALLQERVAGAPDARARFRERLALATVCASTGHHKVALGLFESLDGESVQRGLEEWEPALAAECLEGLFSCLRQMGKGWGPENSERYLRLCRVDPGAAVRVSS